jgi:hypothetical protein
LLYLDFNHHIILVRCNESSLLQKLREEFQFFVTDASPAPETTIEIVIENPPALPSMVAVKLLENCVVYQLGTRQYLDYFGEALTIWDSSEKHVQIFSLNETRLFELAYLSIHSILGQDLDKDGLCRLHAVAISINNVNAIVMLPSKGGKSTLLKNVLRNPEVKIISDDMPLCDRQGKIYPFPSKMSLNDVPEDGPLATLTWHEFKRHHYPTKFTASLSQMKDRLNKNPQDNINIVVAGFRLSSGNSLLSEVPKWKMISPMMEHMIMGFGLPQILEMFLKFNLTDLWKLFSHAVMRSICAFNLIRKSRCYYFYMGPDKVNNAQLLLDIMYEHQNT